MNHRRGLKSFGGIHATPTSYSTVAVYVWGPGHNKSSLFPEDGDVGDGGGEEEGAVAADRNHLGRVEAHVARQLWIEWRRNGEG